MLLYSYSGKYCDTNGQLQHGKWIGFINIMLNERARVQHQPPPQKKKKEKEKEEEEDKRFRMIQFAENLKTGNIKLCVK